MRIQKYQKLRGFLINLFNVEVVEMGGWANTTLYKYRNWWFGFYLPNRMIKMYSPVEGFRKIKHFAMWRNCQQGHVSDFNETHKTYEVNGIKWS